MKRRATGFVRRFAWYRAMEAKAAESLARDLADFVELLREDPTP